MIDTDQIAAIVTAYLDRHPSDVARLVPFTAALAQSSDLASRATVPGHVTCSAIVVNADRRVLHIRHNILGRWLGPGGHLEAGDVSLVEAAGREVTEETGIPAELLVLVDDIPADIDVHAIPANPVKNEPAHDHYDMRFVFTVPSDVEVRLQIDEVNDSAWLPMTELEPAHLVDRVTRLLS